MADTHGVEHAADDHGAVFKAYVTVFIALSVFTAVSFVVNQIFGIGSQTGAAIIMIVAVIKACLVGLIFMHLKWDWYKLYFMIVPAFIIGTMMIIVLLPDIVLAWNH
jgi:caa(3)-type oxidase subunit IV